MQLLYKAHNTSVTKFVPATQLSSFVNINEKKIGYKCCTNVAF